MIKDIPIKESHIITFVSSPVFTFGVRLLLSPDGSSETGGVFVVIGGRHYFVCRRDDGLSVRVRMQVGLSLKHE